MERLTYRDDNGRALLTHFGKQMYCSTQATADCVCMLEERLEETISLLKEQEKKWIPFVKRPLTEEEKRNHPGWCFILDGEVPDDEQEILLYRPWKNKDGYIIEMDRYINNGDTVYLEGAMDIENGMFWMPLPEPPKEG